RKTGGRRRRLATIVSGGLALVVVGFSPAMAQKGSEPIPLTPPATGQTPPASQPPAPVTPSTVAPATIATEVLDAVDSEAVGTLTLAQGGFGTEIWSGSERRQIMQLVDLLPARSPSRTVRDLMHRLLLSTAIPPATEDGADDGTLLARRLAKLVEMGDNDGALGLVRAAPRRELVPDLVGAEVDLLLLNYDNAGACSLVQGTIGRFTSADWLQRQVYCQSLLGQPARALLGLELLREDGVVDPILTTGIEVLTGVIADRPVITESMPEPSALRLALLRSVNQQLPADVLETRSAALLRTIALSPNAPLAVRLEAAERAEIVGSLETANLAELYTSVAASGDDLNRAVESVGPGSGAGARAVLYQAVRAQSVASTRATVMAQFWQVARAESLYPMAVRLMVPLMAEIVPTGELAWFAGDAAKAYLAVGALDQARAWVAVLQTAALRDPAFAPEAGQLAALLALMETPPPVREADAAASTRGIVLTADDQTLSPPPAAPPVLNAFGGMEDADGRTLILIEALGYRVADDVWRARLDGSAMRQRQSAPGAIMLRALQAAVDTGRTGEAILMALVMLGDQPLDEVSTSTLSAAVRALALIGQEEAARNLVIEATAVR
ncbi:MAG: hypothetical protein RIC83_03745, partial [Alphaproteobacteria bacterium]